MTPDYRIEGLRDQALQDLARGIEDRRLMAVLGLMVDEGKTARELAADGWSFFVVQADRTTAEYLGRAGKPETWRLVYRTPQIA